MPRLVCYGLDYGMYSVWCGAVRVGIKCKSEPETVGTQAEYSGTGVPRSFSLKRRYNVMLANRVCGSCGVFST